MKHSFHSGCLMWRWQRGPCRWKAARLHFSTGRVSRPAGRWRCQFCSFTAFVSLQKTGSTSARWTLWPKWAAGLLPSTCQVIILGKKCHFTKSEKLKRLIRKDSSVWLGTGLLAEMKGEFYESTTSCGRDDNFWSSDFMFGKAGLLKVLCHAYFMIFIFHPAVESFIQLIMKKTL